MLVHSGDIPRYTICIGDARFRILISKASVSNGNCPYTTSSITSNIENRKYCMSEAWAVEFEIKSLITSSWRVSPLFLDWPYVVVEKSFSWFDDCLWHFVLWWVLNFLLKGSAKICWASSPVGILETVINFNHSAEVNSIYSSKQIRSGRMNHLILL